MRKSIGAFRFLWSVRVAIQSTPEKIPQVFPNSAGTGSCAPWPSCQWWCEQTCQGRSENAISYLRCELWVIYLHH